MLERRVSIITGMAVAAMGALPIAWLITSPSPQQQPSPSTIAAAAVPGLEPAPSEIRVESPPPEIDGITEAVSRVLAARGFAGSEGVDQLPKSVAGVLAQRGITLTIAGEGEG